MATKKKKSSVNSAGNYTKPAMRKRLFNKIKAGSKGGRAGQWSARKAQMLAKQYKANGGGYRGQHGFKETAERLEISELRVWAVFFEKHLQSILAHMKNANLKKSEPIHSRFADVINYCYLGYALFVERDGKKKFN